MQRARLAMADPYQVNSAPMRARRAVIISVGASQPVLGDGVNVVLYWSVTFELSRLKRSRPMRTPGCNSRSQSWDDASPLAFKDSWTLANRAKQFA